jgi:hypothetical protein
VFGSKKKKAMNLMQTGARGIGTVLNVQDTGMTMNDNPRVKMTFSIEPLDGSPAFEASKSTFVSRVQIPRNGDRYPCWYDPSDPSTWAYAMIADDTGRAQIRQLFGAKADTITGIGPAAGAPAPGAVATAAPPAADPLDRLKKLEELRASGILTDAEFAAKKSELLAEL